MENVLVEKKTVDGHFPGARELPSVFGCLVYNSCKLQDYLIALCYQVIYIVILHWVSGVLSQYPPNLFTSINLLSIRLRSNNRLIQVKFSTGCFLHTDSIITSVLSFQMVFICEHRRFLWLNHTFANGHPNERREWTYEGTTVQDVLLFFLFCFAL